MVKRRRELVGIDPDQMETVRQVAEWTGRTEDEVICNVKHQPEQHTCQHVSW